MAGKKILIVEDTKLFLDMETSFLSREDFSIEGTRSGAEAIRIAKSIKPDLVILDHHLPDMNGDRVCRVIRADPALHATKVIVITGDDTRATSELYRGMGCDAVLHKPFTRSDINAAVENALGTNIRQVRRAHTEIPCIVRIDGDGYTCRVLNISVVGMYIEIDLLPEPGRQLEVDLAVPPSIFPVQIDVVVKWTSEMVEREIPRGIGVEFTDLPDDIRELVTDHIEKIVREGK